MKNNTLKEERRLALPEEILLQVSKPERYIGNEINAVSDEIISNKL